MTHAAIAAPSAARCMVDLAWLLESAPLLSLAPQRFSAAVQSFNTQQTCDLATWLAQVNSSDLHTYVLQAMPHKAPMRLGRYAERLMEYALRYSGAFNLVAANVPLRRTISQTDTADDKQHTTVGEFDYLLTDTAGQHWHWEMAVKFYLCHAESHLTHVVADDFKGPAGKDTLALKLNKVFEKQLKHQPPPPYDTQSWQPAAYARGWLFYPHGASIPACDALNPHHLQGWWLGLLDFEMTKFEGAHFIHLPRLHWLAPYALDELPVVTQTDMVQYLRDLWSNPDGRQKDAAQMIACVAPQPSLITADPSGATLWTELSRGFVVPPT